MPSFLLLCCIYVRTFLFSTISIKSRSVFFYQLFLFIAFNHASGSLWLALGTVKMPTLSGCTFCNGLPTKQSTSSPSISNNVLLLFENIMTPSLTSAISSHPAKCSRHVIAAIVLQSVSLQPNWFLATLQKQVKAYHPKDWVLAVNYYNTAWNSQPLAFTLRGGYQR